MNTYKKLPLLSIVIPVYNEEDNVEILYKEIRNAVDQLQKRYEIIFVDDGSSDTTFKCLKKIKEKEKHENGAPLQTLIMRFTRNFGQTAAMQAGFDHAKGEIIVSLDGDLQNDPSDIPRLLTKLEEGYDVVCGWRKYRKDDTLTRILPSKVANWLIGIITGVPIHDNGCSLKVHRSFIIKSLRLYSDMHRFIPAMSTLGGARATEMVVNHRPRRYGKTKYGLTRIWKVLFDVVGIKMLVSFHDRPFWWFTIFGLIFCLLGVLLGVAAIFLFMRGDRSIVLPAASLLSFYLFGSLLSWGLLAEFSAKVETTIEGRQSSFLEHQ